MIAPSFPFYVRDWLCSNTVRSLHRSNTRGVAAYLYLLCEAWGQDECGTLPNDHVELADFARVNSEEWREIWPLISSQFVLGPDGRLHNQKLTKIRHVQRVNRENGLRSVASRSTSRSTSRYTATRPAVRGKGKGKGKGQGEGKGKE